MSFIDPSNDTSGGIVKADVRIEVMWITLYILIALSALFSYRRIMRLAMRNPWPTMLVALACVSAAWSAAPALTLQHSAALCGTTIAGLYFGVTLSPERQVRTIAGALGIAAVLSTVAAIALPSYATTAAYGGAWRGVFNHKNTLGHAMVFCAIAAFYAGKQARGINRTIWYSISCLAVFNALLSRSATTVVLLIVLSVLYCSLPILKSRLRFALPLYCSAIAVGIVTTPFLVNLVESGIALLGKDSSLSGRTPVWQFAALAFLKHPWFGYGYDGFWSVYGGDNAIAFTGWSPAHAHNGYLQIAVDLGVVGLAVFLVGYIIALRRALWLLRHSRSSLASWPLMFLVYGIIYNITLPGFLLRNGLFWVYYIASWSYLKSKMDTLPAPNPCLPYEQEYHYIQQPAAPVF